MKVPTFALDGLQTDPGPFSAASDGALVEAQNVVCDRVGLIEPRAPFTFTQDAALLAGAPTTQHGHQVEGQPMRTWSFDAVGPSWIMRSAQTTTITGPTSFTRGRLHSEYVRGRLLFTSEDGVCEWPQAGTIAYRAGVMQPSMPWGYVATGVGRWLATGTSVAYRFTISRVRADGTTMESAPTAPFIVRNTSGTAGWVEFIPLPGLTYTPWSVGSSFDALQTGDMLNVYRAPVLAAATGTPSDVMRLRASLPIVGGAVQAFQDKLLDTEWNGPELYTNARRDGIGKARKRPAYARDVTTYNRMTMYAGYETPMRVAVTCKAIGDITSDPSQALCTKQIAVTTALSVNLTGISAADIAYMAVGQWITLTTNTPGTADARFQVDTQIATINVGAGTATLTKAALVAGGPVNVYVWDWVGVTVGGTTYRQFAQPPASTVIQDNLWLQASNATGVRMGGYADLEMHWNNAASRFTDILLHAVGSDEVNGQPEYRNVLMVFERASQSTAPFTVKSSKPNAFNRVVDSVTGIASAMDGGDARLAVSTPDIPDAVPELQTLDIGDLASPIYRIVPLRASVLVVKGDGLYLVYGNDPASLSVTKLDGTVTLPRYDIAANWLTVQGDTVYMMSSRGPVAITDAGVTMFGEAIYETLREMLGPGFEKVGTATAVSAGAAPATPYVLFSYYDASLPQAQGEAVFVCNVGRQAWTTWRARRAMTALWTGANSTQVAAFVAGRVGVYRDDRTAMGAPITATSVALTGDAGIPIASSTPILLSTNRYTLGKGAGHDVVAGDVIIRDGRICIVEAVPTATTITVVTNGALVIAPGTGTFIEAYPVRVIWTSRVLGTLTSEKQYSEVAFAFALRALMLRLTGYFQGAYAPGGVQTISQPQITPGWSDGSSTDTETLLAAPDQIGCSVPLDVVRDWGLRVGFTLQQAYAWFSLGAVVLTAEEGSARVGRLRS